MDEFTETLKSVSCPTCGRIGTLRLGSTLVAKPIGSFSLAGAQMKVSATEMPQLTCSADGCDFREIAKRA